ncbi:MAG: PLP-dependent transferase [Mangrovibacterium sp.]
MYLQKKYLKVGFGGVLSFLINGGKEAADEFINNLKLISHLANVGDAKNTHYSPGFDHPSAVVGRRTTGSRRVIPGSIRLSVGIEHVTDIIDDLAQAFEKVKHLSGIKQGQETLSN